MIFSETRFESVRPVARILYLQFIPSQNQIKVGAMNFTSDNRARAFCAIFTANFKWLCMPKYRLILNLSRRIG